jgi:hypothetical protein
MSPRVDALIKTFAKSSKKSEVYVQTQWNMITQDLLDEGVELDETRFYPYATTRLKKRLKIKESNQVLKRFKDFLKEKNET